MKKPIMWLAVIFASSTLLYAGCSDDSSESRSGEAGSIQVGFSQVGAESGWRTAETNSIQSEAKKRGIDLRFADAQGKQENQMKALRSFIVQKVDAIILAPKVSTGWEPVLKEAKRAKIPVVLVDRAVDADESLYATLIAADFIEEGRMAAKRLAKELDGKGNIIQLEGTPGASAAIDRKKGFEEAIAEFPEMKIIFSQSGEFARADGKNVMQALLSNAKGAGQQVHAVYAHNDEMAIGAIQAIEEAGLQPGKDVLVVSIDGQRDAVKAIVDRKLLCTVECNPMLGPMAFDAVEEILAGKEVPKKTVVPGQVFDQSNAKDVLPNRDY